MGKKIKEIINRSFKDSISLKQNILDSDNFSNMIQKAANMIIESLNNGGKILFCGNGGSAADAQHIAAELSGRFYYDRPPLYSEALHVNTSYLTAVANDYSYDDIYSRLVLGQGCDKDVLIGISTSGNSKNIINAFNVARDIGMSRIGMTGISGGLMRDNSDILLNVPSNDTPRIQEAHILIGHTICEIVETLMFPK